MNKKDVNKVVNLIISLINKKIPHKIEKLESKYGIGIHTCNLGKDVILSNNEKLNISVNAYLDTFKDSNSGNSRGVSYDIFIGNESYFVRNESGFLDEYFHDIDDEDDENFELMEKVCEKINKGQKEISNEKSDIKSYSVSEILGMK